MKREIIYVLAIVLALGLISFLPEVAVSNGLIFCLILLISYETHTISHMIMLIKYKTLGSGKKGIP